MRRRPSRTGRCRLTFRAPGFRTLTAVKPADGDTVYEPATALIRAITQAASRGRVPGLATYEG